MDSRLKRWNKDTVENFLEKAKDGRLKKAEDDAIDLKQLVVEEEKLRTLLAT